MTRRSLSIVAAIAFFAVPVGLAHGWWVYPGGWGEWGWPGWGATTVEGDMARGAGVLAAGMGQFNLQTAHAESINADTVMRFNQYLYESQQSVNQRYLERRARQRERNRASAAAIYERLRNNPEPLDIVMGNALNVAFDEISNPRVHIQSLSGSGALLPGLTIKNIPFQYAAAAISVSLFDLVKPRGAPAPLRNPEFASLMERIQADTADLVTQNTEDGVCDPKSLADMHGLIEATWKKLDEMIPDKLARERRDADRYLKSLTGLYRMLEMPELSGVLSDAANRKEVSLGDLLRFMTSFNLRFGPATTPAQKGAYRLIYPLLVQLRDQLPRESQQAALAVAPAEHTTSPQEFFEPMDRADLEATSEVPPSSASGSK